MANVKRDTEVALRVEYIKDLQNICTTSAQHLPSAPSQSHSHYAAVAARFKNAGGAHGNVLAKADVVFFKEHGFI